MSLEKDIETPQQQQQHAQQQQYGRQAQPYGAPASALAPTPAVGLPPNWVQHLDNASNKTYYHNTITNVTTWDRPM